MTDRAWEEARGSEAAGHTATRDLNTTITQSADAEMEGSPLPVPPSDPTVTNLHTYHEMCQFEALVTGHFQKVKVLASAINGKVYLMRRKKEGDLVVVKKMPNLNVDQSRGYERNDRVAHLSGGGSMEDSLNEIGIFRYLSERPHHRRYVLRLIAVLRDERDTWLVTENADGGELFNTAASGRPLEERDVMRWIWQLLQATRYMHYHNLGHRDISLENCLLQDRELRLMDFGQAVQLRREGDPSRTLLRYFRPAGKAYYRPPEAYVPNTAEVQAICPPDYVAGSIVQVQTPRGYWCEVLFPDGAVPGQLCSAQPMGYTVPSYDMFSVGVCIFVLHTQNPPWRTATRSDDIFRFIQGSGVEALFKAWHKPLLAARAMELLSALLQAECARRPSVTEALANEWFNTMPNVDEEDGAE